MAITLNAKFIAAYSASTTRNIDMSLDCGACGISYLRAFYLFIVTTSLLWDYSTGIGEPGLAYVGHGSFSALEKGKKYWCNKVWKQSMVIICFFLL